MSKTPGFYDVLRYKAEGDIFADMMRMTDELKDLKSELSEMKTLVMRSMVLTNEIFLENKRLNEELVKSKVLK